MNARTPDEPHFDLGSGTDWQRIWVAVTRGNPWRTLAVVPGGQGAPDDFTLEIAMALTRTGMMYTGTQIHVADATRLNPSDASEFAGQLRESISSGPVILALAPADTSPLTVPLAQSANGAVLCILLNRMRMSEAKRTVEDIGADHFLGAVTFT
jgi:hypothetical protein